MKKLSDDQELIQAMRGRGFALPEIVPTSISEPPSPPVYKSDADVLRALGGRPEPDDNKAWDSLRDVREKTDLDRAQRHLDDARAMVTEIERILEGR